MTIKIFAGIVATANDRMDVWEPGYLIIRDGLIVEAGPDNGPEGALDETVVAPPRSSYRGWSTGSRFAVEPAQGIMGPASAGNLPSVYPRQVHRHPCGV